MIHDPRVTAYTAAAIQGMLAAESPDIQLNAKYLAERSQEIVQYVIALEDGEELPAEEELQFFTPTEDPELEPPEEIPEQDFSKSTKPAWPLVTLLAQSTDSLPQDDFQSSGPGELQANWHTAATPD